MHPNLTFGTCSWKYESWRGLVYSDTAKENYLQEYARSYGSVEIDQWFWSLFGVDKVSMPSPATVSEYQASVPGDFRFTIKMPNSLSLTHFYRKRKNDPLVANPYFLSTDLLNDFLATIEPLKAQTAALMMQFEYLNKQKMRDQYDFHKCLERFFTDADRSWPYALEPRNPWYLNRRYFDFLRKLQVGHVFLQGYYMPDIVQVYERHRDQIEGQCVIRLHGGDRKEIEEKSGENWNRIWEDRGAELRSVADMIGDLLTRGIRVFVNVNNHYEGSAPITIERLQTLLGDE